MEIEFDNTQDKEFFETLLDSFVSMSELDDVELNFINRLFEAIK